MAGGVYEDGERPGRRIRLGDPCNLHTADVHNYWAWDHMHNAPMARPLLVLDMYEHSYHLDYGAAAAKYVEAFMQNVDWDEVNRRLEGALGARLV